MLRQPKFMAISDLEFGEHYTSGNMDNRFPTEKQTDLYSGRFKQNALEPARIGVARRYCNGVCQALKES
jgi:hypothetical protein